MRPYFAMPEDGWYNIAIAGEFPHSTGYIQVLDADAFHAIVEDVHQQMGRPNWPGILVDFDHDSLDASKPSAAAGWLVDIAERPDGLWAKIRWSDMGQKALEGGSFRFVSPVWLLEDCEELGEKRVRPKKLMNCAITNCPNIKGMIPLTNRADAAAPRFAPPGRALPVVDCVEVPRAELAALGAFLRNDARQPMTDEQRKAMFARLGSGGGGTLRKGMNPFQLVDAQVPTLPDLIQEHVIQPAKNALNNLQNPPEREKSLLEQKTDAFMSGLWEGIKESAPEVYNSLKNATPEVIASIIQGLPDFANGVGDFVGSVRDGAQLVGNSFMSGFRGGTSTQSEYEKQYNDVTRRYNLDKGYSEEGIDPSAVRIKNLEAERDGLLKQLREPPDPPATRYKSLSQARREAARKPGATSDSILEAVENAREQNRRYAEYRQEINHIKHTIPKGASQNAALNRAEKKYLSSYFSQAAEVERHNTSVNRRVADIEKQIADTAHNARLAVDRKLAENEAASQKAANAEQRKAQKAEREALQAEQKALAAKERAAAAAQKEAEAQAKAAAKAQAKTQREAEQQAAKQAKAEARAQAQAAKQAAKEADPAYRRSKYDEALHAKDWNTCERLYPGQDHQKHAANVAALEQTNNAGLRKKNVAMYLETRLTDPLPNAMSDEQRKAMFARLHGGGGGGGGGSGYTPQRASGWDIVKGAASGFVEGAKQGAENVLNAYTFGATDRMGLTHTYEQTGADSEFSKMMAGISALAAYTATGAQLAGVGGGVGIGGGAGAAEAAGSAALRQYAAEQAAEDYFTKSSANEFLEMSRDYVRNSFDLEEALSKLDEVAQNMQWAGWAGDEGVAFKLGDMWYQTPVANLGGAWQADPGRAGMAFFDGVGVGVEPKLADVMAGLENALTRYGNGFGNYVR